eukprot:gene14718-20758_t
MLSSKLSQPSVRMMRMLAFKPCSTSLRCKATDTPDVRDLAKRAQLKLTDQEGLVNFSKWMWESATSGSAPAAGKAPPAADTPVELNFEALKALDIRVGKIVSSFGNREKIDVGEESLGLPLFISCRRVKYVPWSKCQDRMVLVLCNLKPRNMRGIKSNGMVLAASDAAKENVEPVMPPEGAVVGERVWFGEDKEQPAPSAPNATEKKKLWDKVAPGLRTDGKCVANYGGLEMMTSAGPTRPVSRLVAPHQSVDKEFTVKSKKTLADY